MVCRDVSLYPVDGVHLVTDPVSTAAVFLPKLDKAKITSFKDTGDSLRMSIERCDPFHFHVFLSPKWTSSFSTVWANQDGTMSVCVYVCVQGVRELSEY